LTVTSNPQYFFPKNLSISDVKIYNALTRGGTPSISHNMYKETLSI